MFVSEVVILKSLVELLAVVAEILGILGLLLRFCLWLSTNFLGWTFLDDYFLDDSSILFYFRLNHLDDLRLYVLYFRVQVLISYLSADFGHQLYSRYADITIFVL